MFVQLRSIGRMAKDMGGTLGDFLAMDATLVNSLLCASEEFHRHARERTGER